MAEQKRDYLDIENAQLMFRNFSGKPTKYVKNGGIRNFSIVLDQDTADRLLRDGWNIRQLAKRNPDDPIRYLLTVAVSYDNYPPKIAKKTERSKKVVYLDQEDIDCLDYDDIIKADVRISPYHWTVNGNSGIKAYLKSLYVTIAEDPFADEFEKDAIPAEEDLPF